MGGQFGEDDADNQVASLIRNNTGSDRYDWEEEEGGGGGSTGASLFSSFCPPRTHA